jgi:hypothetical protein
VWQIVSLGFLTPGLYTLLTDDENYRILWYQIICLVSTLVFFSEYIYTQTKLNKSSPFDILRAERIRYQYDDDDDDYDKFNLIVKYTSISESQKFGFPIEKGQEYKVVFNENPISRIEAEILLLVHPKSDDNQVIIAQIEDNVLPYILREGKYSLKNELISISNTNELEISLWFFRDIR